LNNNRSNRRRGRGNRNQGGGNNANRIDSRARGNAPQLLDKYKKLAQDAQHNGDRVQAEYYLQFADHYFRVIADNKARQDEARGKRHDDRDQGDDDDGDDYDNRRHSRHSRGRRDDDEGDQFESERGQEGESSNDSDQGDEGDVGERKPRRQRADNRGPKRKPRGESNGREDSDAIDIAALPPSISADEEVEERAPRPRRRKLAVQSSDEGDDDIQAIG